MAAAVREVTPKGVIFMENCYYSNLGIPYAALAPTVNGVREPNVSYSPHAYDLTVDTPGYAYASNDRVGSIFAEQRRAQARLQVPVLVGEWGAGYMGEKCYPHIAFLLHLFDAYQWSFAYFTYTEDLYDSPLMDILVRPYPAAVNGEVKAFGFDAGTGLFTLEFTQADGFDPALVTEIYLPHSAGRVEAAGFEWREEATGGGEGKTLLLTGGGAGEHRVTVQL
jgi:endoglycosylceramidase